MQVTYNIVLVSSEYNSNTHGKKTFNYIEIYQSFEDKKEAEYFIDSLFRAYFEISKFQTYTYQLERKYLDFLKKSKDRDDGLGTEFMTKMDELSTMKQKFFDDFHISFESINFDFNHDHFQIQERYIYDQNMYKV